MSLGIGFGHYFRNKPTLDFTPYIRSWFLPEIVQRWNLDNPAHAIWTDLLHCELFLLRWLQFY